MKKNTKTIKSEPKTKLLGGYSAPTPFYKLIHWYAEFGLVDTKRGSVFQAKDVCGDICWDALGDKYFKCLAGRCFAHLVSTGQLPLGYVNKKSNTKHYRFID